MTVLEPGRHCVLPEEQRYPLDLTSRLAAVRRLYDEASADRWDPETDFDLSGVGRHVSPEARRAGALVWSHRARVEYRGIGESEAALVRLCLERDREVDVKYLLTARGTAKALGVEACWLVAEQLGGYVDSPGSSSLTELLHDRVARRMLHNEVDPDAFVIGHFVLADAIDLAVWRASAAHHGATGSNDPTLGALLARMIVAKERHVEFGWAYAAVRLPALDAERRRAVEDNLAFVLQRERSGLRVAAGLADGSPASAALVAAVDVAATAGLGVAPNARLTAVLEDAVVTVGTGLAPLGITLPAAVTTSVPEAK